MPLLTKAAGLSGAARFLDNVDGAFGCVPMSWQAVLDCANPQGAGGMFNNPPSRQTDEFVDTIHAPGSEANDESYGEGQWFHCQGATLSDLSDGIKKITSELTHELGDEAGLMEGFAK